MENFRVEQQNIVTRIKEVVLPLMKMLPINLGGSDFGMDIKTVKVQKRPIGTAKPLMPTAPYGWF